MYIEHSHKNNTLKKSFLWAHKEHNFIAASEIFEILLNSKIG